MGGRSVVIREPEFDPGLGDLRHILDIGFKVQEETRGPRTSNRWYASNLGYCLRRQFFERAGVPKMRGIDRPRVMWLGRVVEHAMIARVRHSGLLLFEQLHLVSEENEVSGYVDFGFGGLPVPEAYEEGEISEEWLAYLNGYKASIAESYREPIPVTAVELKTAAQYSAEKMFTEGPQFTHKMQAALYRAITEDDPTQLPEGVEQIERFQIAVFAKNTAHMLVFPILDTHVEQVRDRLGELNGYWPETIPPCTCGKTPNMGWEKDYCAYKSGSSCCATSAILDAPEEYWALTEPTKETVGVEA